MPETTETTTPETNEKRPRAGAIGRTGTVNTDGWIQGTEENPNLQWPKSLNVYSNMYRTEIAVRAMVAYVTMPLRAADWSPVPASEDPQDEEIAEFCKAAMAEVEGGFDDFMRRLLSYLRMGFYVGEKCWELRTIEYAGKTKEAFIVTKVADRLQRTIHKWHNESGRGQLTTIEQWVGDGHDPVNVMLPREKCILIVNEQEGEDYFGNSILRAAYGAFTNKRKLEVVEAIGIERSIGVVVAYTPDNAGDAVLDDVEEQLEKLHQAESMYLIAPGPKQQTGLQQGGSWLFESLDVKGDAGTAKAHQAIQRYTTELAQNVLAEFMRLGHNETGARATGDTQKNPYTDALKGVAKHVGDILFREYLTPMVRLNFGEDANVPKLDAVGLDKVDVGALAESFSKFAAAGGLTITAKDENIIRRQLGFPEIDEDERDEIQQEKIEQAQAAMKAAGPENTGDPKKDEQAAKAADPAKAQKPNKFSASRTPEFTPNRELRGAEKYVAWDVIDRSIDAQRSEFAIAGAGPVANWIDQTLAGENPSNRELARALQSELAETAQFGAVQVTKELDRQRQRPVETFEVSTPKLSGDAIAEIKRRAELAAEAILTNVAVALRRVRIDNLRRKGSGTIEGDLRDAGIEAGRVALRDEALENITATLNLGRDDEAKRQDVVQATLSSVLDSGSCGPCMAADGTETTVDSATYGELSPPLSDCEGANRCRCIWVYTGSEQV